METSMETLVKQTYIDDFNSDKVEMEIYECECGYHHGVDGTFLNQVGDINGTCPSCKEKFVIHVRVLLKKDLKETSEKIMNEMNETYKRLAEG